MSTTLTATPYQPAQKHPWFHYSLPVHF